MTKPEIFAAAQAGDRDSVMRLLDAGADPDARASGGETALMAAAARGAVDIMEILVARGADVNATTDAGNTALMLAAARGRTEALRFLLVHGAGRDHRNRFGLGAADWAKWSDRSADVLALLGS
ncbi:MAG TPA: ankyrin repeat domain-containing protein [Alphaproteobacteria bacterium]